jgi:DNA-directed RNA polymerase specialized sigma24 family protein
VTDRADSAERHEAALAFGRRLLEHRWPVPLVLSDAPAPSRAETLLQQCDWLRLEDAYERLDGDEQTALDLTYGLKPGDSDRRTLAEVAAALGVRQAAAAATVRRAVARLDASL